MSTPRVGPHAPPVGAPQSEPDQPAPAGKAAIADNAPTDRAVVSAPKGPVHAKTQATTTATLARPTTQPATERRARFGGERGAWLASTRRGILFAANNPDVGQELLEAFNRGTS